uniref:Uncharacterized protein n=1 Tax=Cairina moschata TaxID=8855 RepID=A0A8C3BEA0_CAIMO
FKLLWRWWSHRPWGCSRRGWTWCLGTRVSGDTGGRGWLHQVISEVKLLQHCSAQGSEGNYFPLVVKRGEEVTKKMALQLVCFSFQLLPHHVSWPLLPSLFSVIKTNQPTQPTSLDGFLPP